MDDSLQLIFWIISLYMIEKRIRNVTTTFADKSKERYTVFFLSISIAYSQLV